jgi:Spy/CpxP family protein refolding chaperone
MKRSILCAAAVLTLAMSVSAAPLPPGKWWRRPEFATNLQLTNDQQVRLDMIFRMAANDLIDLRADAEKTSIAIRSELDQDQINRENLRKLAAKLSETQGKLFDKELMMLLDMRSVLSNEQWGRLRSELDRPREGSQHPRQRQ